MKKPPKKETKDLLGKTTVRGLQPGDCEVFEKLKERGAENGRSLSSEIFLLMKNSVGTP